MAETVSTPPLLPPDTSTLPPPSKLTTTIPSYHLRIQTIINHFSNPNFKLPTNLKTLKDSWKKRGKFIPSTFPDSSLSSSEPEDGSVIPSPSYSQFISSSESFSSSSKTTWESLAPHEKFYLTYEQFGRFLRAVKGDEGKALERAELTTVWRREFGVDVAPSKDGEKGKENRGLKGINEDWSRVEEESKTGKQINLGYDMHSRPCLYMHPYRQNTKVSPRQVEFVVWNLERAIDLMPPGVDNLCLLIDLGSGIEGGGGQPTTMSQARKVLEVLQTYYCERLGRAICVNVNALFYAFYKLVGPFVDPVTKDKIKFNPDVRELVPPDQLEKRIFKGDLPFEYNHEEFWPALHDLCMKRREANMSRWEEAGSKVGEKEWIIRGGDDWYNDLDEWSAAEEDQQPNGDEAEVEPNGDSGVDGGGKGEDGTVKDLSPNSTPLVRPSGLKGGGHHRRKTGEPSTFDVGENVIGEEPADVPTPSSSVFRGGDSSGQTSQSVSTKGSRRGSFSDDGSTTLNNEQQQPSLREASRTKTEETSSSSTEEKEGKNKPSKGLDLDELGKGLEWAKLDQKGKDGESYSVVNNNTVVKELQRPDDGGATPKAESLKLLGSPPPVSS